MDENLAILIEHIDETLCQNTEVTKTRMAYLLGRAVEQLTKMQGGQ